MLPRPETGDVSGATFVHNILVFGRLLRSAGFAMSAGREMELLRALQLVDMADRARVYQAARAVLVSNRDQGPIFDRAFELFFRRVFDRPPIEDSTESRQVTSSPSTEEGETADSEGDLSGGEAESQVRYAPGDENSEGGEGESSEQAQTFSSTETLRETEFDRFTAADHAAARELMRNLRLRPATRRTRRMVSSSSGRHLDMRSIVRRLQRTAGEPTSLAWRRRKLKRRKLVLICDISGSMESYSRILLQFLHGVRQGLSDVEVFVFGTRLTRVSRDLQHRDLDAALEMISHRVLDFAGGTRIGRSLHDFNHVWARRVLGHGAVVIIISDGWDRGDPELLRAQMERLQRGCFRLIWLNPLLGLPEYQPITIGMRTALEFVDDFMPAHNLASLEQLARRLSELEERRPVRRQGSQPTEVLR